MLCNFHPVPPALLETILPPGEHLLSHEPANNDLPLFSQLGVIPEFPRIPTESQTQDVPTATAEAEVSLADTSAPLLTNPSLTDVQVTVPPLPDGTFNLQNTNAVTPGIQHRRTGCSAKRPWHAC